MCADSDSDVSQRNGLTTAVVQYTYDERVLQRGQLTDEHIDFANNILKRQHKHIDGLESPLLSQTFRGFSVPSKVNKCVQIHHLGGHWATSYRPANCEDVYVYDSMQSYNYCQEPIIVDEYQTQLRQMYASDGKPVTVYCSSTTQQTNGRDCGVFAIAFAVDLCAGKDPGRREYDHRGIRSHIVNCFKVRALSPFPSTGERILKLSSVFV